MAIKSISPTEFICDDPNCPHCSYDENAPLVTDEEIEEQAIKYNINWKHSNDYKAFKAGAQWVRDQYEN